MDDRMPRPGPDERPLDDPVTIDRIPDTSGFDEPVERGKSARMEALLDDPGPGAFDGPAGMAGAGTDEVGDGSAGRYLASDVGRGPGTPDSGDADDRGRGAAGGQVERPADRDVEVDVEEAFRTEGIPRFDGTTTPAEDADRMRSLDEQEGSDRLAEGSDRPEI